jgi:WD40 repeat protein
MIRANARRFGAIRTLVLVGFFPLGLLTGTAVPALAGSSGTWMTTGSMNTAREAHTATLLPNSQVLVAGGFNGNVLASAELYDPARGKWIASGSLSTARDGGTATLLPNGQVLVAGGSDATLNTLSSAELYNPATGKWTVTGSMNTARDGHTATLLPNGHVLVAGGNAFVNNSFLIFSSAELYNPSTGTWTKTSSMHAAREIHTAMLLPNGQVLVAGGYGPTGSFNASLSSAELYNPFTPFTGKWIATGSLNTARYGQTAVLLANRQVLVLDGVDVSPGGGTFPLSSTEQYDRATGKWTVNGKTFQSGSSGFVVTLLRSGRILIAGGVTGVYPHEHITAAAELYDPSTGTSASTGGMNIARQSHTATLLPNGQVLVAGGSSPSSTVASAELYTP